MGAERTALQTTGRYAALVALVTFVAVPIHVYVEPPWRSPVVRTAVALVLGVALLDLRRALARRLASGPGGGGDGWRRRTWLAPGVPQAFLDAVGDLQAGTRTRRHFERVLWPRLAALSPRPLEPPPCRSLGRGPSLSSLRAVIAALEREP